MTTREAQRVTRDEQPLTPELTPALRRRMRTTSVAERIRWARTRYGVSQELFAELIGSSRRHMIRLEKGRGNGDGTNPDPQTRERLAQVTELPADFFVDENSRR